jgi:hypothetical protein
MLFFLRKNKDMLFKTLLSLSLLGVFSNVAQASLQTYLEKYTPKWMQHLSPISSGAVGTQADIDKFEAIFQNLKPIPDKTRGNPVFSKLTALGRKPSITLYGPGEFNDVIFSGNIQGFGPLQLTYVDVHKLSVEGLLNAQNSVFKEVHVVGSAQLARTKVSGITTISGNLGAKHSIFHNKITVRGSKVILSGCEVLGDLHVQHLRSQTKVQRVYLLKGSHIQGKVIFSKNATTPCKVFKSPDSKIHDKVVNGTVELFEGA